MVYSACEICNKKYTGEDREIRARSCEAKGIIGEEYKPGLTYQLAEWKSDQLFENLYIILKNEKTIGHYRRTRVGNTDFASDSTNPNEYLNRWGFAIINAIKVQEMIEKGDLKEITDDELTQLEQTLKEWEKGKDLRSPHADNSFYNADVRSRLLDDIRMYGLELHNNYK